MPAGPEALGAAAALMAGFRRAFWLDPEHQRAETWSEHRDIDEVMLATRLVPKSFLVLPPFG